MDRNMDPGGPAPGDDETGLLESLRRVDNYLDDIGDQQEELAELLRQQRDGIERLIEAVGGEPVSLAPDPSTYLYNMSVLVPADTQENDPLTETREIEYDGIIRQVRVVSVAAAQQAVGAQFGFASGERVLPRDDPGDARYVPLAGEPITNEPNVSISEGEEIEYKFANNDQDQAHFVTALVQIEEDS